jgi:hypothetical protein
VGAGNLKDSLAAIRPRDKRTGESGYDTTRKVS